MSIPTISCKPKDVKSSDDALNLAGFQTDASGQVNCGEGGQYYEATSLLDSGASLASLYTTDLKEMGIVKKYYSAQGFCHFNMANGAKLKSRVYEVYVEVNGNEGTPIIDPQNPIVPNRRVVGGIFPVTEIPETIDDPYSDASYGINNRLSGIMPFLSSYVSFVPGSNVMLLGENRNDIIGHYKMPPFKVWDFYGSQKPEIVAHFNYMENPILHFEHRDENITETDYTRSAVQTTKNGQTYLVSSDMQWT